MRFFQDKLVPANRHSWRCYSRSNAVSNIDQDSRSFSENRTVYNFILRTRRLHLKIVEFQNDSESFMDNIGKHNFGKKFLCIGTTGPKTVENTLLVCHSLTDKR